MSALRWSFTATAAAAALGTALSATAAEPERPAPPEAVTPPDGVPAPVPAPAAVAPPPPVPAPAPVPAPRRTDVASDAAEPPDDGTLGTHQTHTMGIFGIRTAFITNAGFDPFADSNQLVQSSFGFGRTALAIDDASLAIVGFWDFGARKSDLRGQDTSLSVHRLTVGPEFRMHVGKRLYGFVRGMPALLNVQGTLSDATVGANLETEDQFLGGTWLAGFDATAGAAFEFFGKQSGHSRKARFWLVAEGGYGWSASTRLELRPDSDDDEADPPQRLAALDLGDLAIRGGMFRISAMATF